MLSKDLRDLILKALTTANEASCRESRKCFRGPARSKNFSAHRSTIGSLARKQLKTTDAVLLKN